MPSRMAGAMSQDPADRSTMGRQARPVPMAAPLCEIGSHDGICGIGRFVFGIPSLLLLNGRIEPPGGLRW